MGKKVLAFGASNSKQSINKKLAHYTAGQLKNVVVELLDLNDFEMPIFSVDRESESGIPDLAFLFKERIKHADGIIISFAEHNGNFSVAFKNIFDWISRIEKDVWLNKPMFLLATSPGGRGGKSVLEIAVSSYSRTNKNTVVSFSLPSFNANFSTEEGITDAELLEAFREKLAQFQNAL